MTLRIGVIGVSLDRGWAAVSHVPAIQNGRGLVFAGVTGRDQGAADAVAKAVGATRGFADADEMVRDPSIDVVTIAVRVPNHRMLVLAALAAGKHVYCEWPLGRDVAESQELLDASIKAGVHTAIGLQSRANPAIRRARSLIEAGAIGRLLSARIYSETGAFGARTNPGELYLEDAGNGATLVAIHGGHALDAAIAVLGELSDVAAMGSTQYPVIEVEGQDIPHRRIIADHLMTLSLLRDGGVVSVAVVGGRSKNPGFRLEVFGERGVLTLDGGAMRGFQSGRLTLSLDGEPETVNEGELDALPDAAFNVGAAYAAFRDDIWAGTQNTPDFSHATHLARLLKDVEIASATGCRVIGQHWPATNPRL
jgi:predicted dehydrogenase